MNFFTVLRVKGHPTAENLYSTVNTFIESQAFPKEKLVSLTSDGASVMQSLGRAVAGFLAETITLHSLSSIVLSIVRCLQLKMAFLNSLAMFIIQLMML